MTNSIQGKTILITGSTDGIGRQTAIDLAKLNAHVIIHGRTRQKAESVANDVRTLSSNPSIDFVSADLSSMDEIHKLSDHIHKQYNCIDVLINNAGVYMNDRKLTKDGLEMTFAVNHISYYLLSGKLLDLLFKSDVGRIVNVASQAHSSELDFDNLQGEKYFEGYDAYSRSKLCNILFSYQLANLLAQSNVSVNALHPGVIATKLLHEGWGGGGTALSEGSKTSVYLASSNEVEGITGEYFSSRRSVKSSPISYNTDIQVSLWEKSAYLTGYVYDSL